MWICWVLITLLLGRSHTVPLDSSVQLENDNITTESPLLFTTDESILSSVEVTNYADKNASFPFMVAILHNNGQLLGAGAIVGERWILATAFQLGAFLPNQLRVRVGSDRPHSGGQLLSVDQLFPHPMFSMFNNDVALLKTGEQLQFSPSVQYIPVATSPPLIGDQATLVVWNNDTEVLDNRVDILPVTDCKVFYPEFELTESNVCVVLDRILPYAVTLYGSPLVSNGSLVGHYMGLEPNTFKPYLCSSLSPLSGWVRLMMTNETDTQLLFPLA